MSDEKELTDDEYKGWLKIRILEVDLFNELTLDKHIQACNRFNNDVEDGLIYFDDDGKMKYKYMENLNER